MLNIIRADLYRIFSGKAVYITFGLLVLFIILQVSGNMFGVSIDTSQSESRIFESGMTDAEKSEAIKDRLQQDNAVAASNASEITGMTAPFAMMKAASNLIYFLLPIIVSIAALDFSSGTVKNVLSHGISRTQYYIAKLVLAFLFSIIILLLNFIIPIIIATVTNGFGGAFTTGWLINVMQAFGAQIIVMLAAVSIGILILFLTKRTAAFTWAYVAFFLLPTILIISFAQFSPDVQNLLNYDLSANFGIVSSINQLPASDILRSLTTSVVYVLIGVTAGIFTFKKSDIK